MVVSPKLLANVHFFRGFSIQQIEEILKISERITLNSSDILIEEGSVGNEMYILISGTMAVTTKKNPNPVAEVKPIGVIGEIGMLLGQHRSATVVAQEFSQLLKISKTKLDPIFSRDPQIELQMYHNLCNILCSKLVKNNVRIDEYTSYSIS